MSGSWIHEKEGERAVESWVGPGNGMIAAANLSTWSSGRKMFEFLRIADTAESFSYFATPAGRAPVEFKLGESSPQRVVFESTANDYPQRIHYWREGDGLMARIAGSVRGASRSEQWRFVRK